MRPWIVPELDDPRMALQGGLNDAALDAAPTSVDEPHFEDTGVHSGVDVVGDDSRDVARGERV